MSTWASFCELFIFTNSGPPFKFAFTKPNIYTSKHKGKCCHARRAGKLFFFVGRTGVIYDIKQHPFTSQEAQPNLLH